MGVVIGREIPKEPTEEALDHSQKLKGIETLSATAQLVSNLKTTTKASRLDYRIQQQSQGSSKGASIILETQKREIQSLMDVPIRQEDLAVQRSPLINMFEQRLSELEKKVDALSKVDHADVIEESIQANIFNKVKNQLPKLLPKAVSEFGKPRMESTVHDVLQKNPINLFKSSSSSTSIDSFTEYELKNMPYDKIKDQSASSKAGKTQSKPSSTNKSVNAEETVHEVAIEADKSMEVEDNVVNFEEQPQDDAAPRNDNSTWFHELVNADKNPLTFDGLMGSIVDFTKNNIKPECNLEQCYLALSDKLDLMNLKGDRGNKERKYASSLTKTKGARAYQKKYTFREADFLRLHLNDIEYMFLVYVKHKLHNLTDDDIVDLMIALRMFTRSIVIKRRVKDVQLGVESYQQKLNITRPQTTFDGISFKEPYTIIYEPKGVVYLNKSNRKRLMQADELYKFSDKTLMSVRDTLHEMLQNFVLGYNHAMLKRAWIEKN
ncbi:hypothetical protein Tco_0961477 [Tanacetum coccineum]